ncbi:MAG: class II glutamine amidotransferase [Lentisphaerota bacterium]
MLKEACGIFGIANHPDAAAITRLGLFALQHRGQESAGIYLLRDGRCELQKGMGLVSEVFDRLPKEWWKTPQEMAIGHVRYSTAGGSNVMNAQPFVVEFDKWRLGLAHNGTISNAASWRNHLKRGGAIFQGDLDTEVILHIAAHHHKAGETPWEAVEYALKNVEGAFSLLAFARTG